MVLLGLLVFSLIAYGRSQYMLSQLQRLLNFKLTFGRLFERL